MVKFLADENFNNQIIRGIAYLTTNIDIVRVQDVGLLGVDDPSILEWAAQKERIVLSHDVATMRNFAYDRINEKLAMPGLFLASDDCPVSLVIEDIILIAKGSFAGEWENQVRFLPLR